MSARLTLSILLLSVIASVAVAQDPIVDLYQRGAAAAQAGENEQYLLAMEEALALAPGHPILLRHCAQALTRLGRVDDALARLREISELGASFDFGAYEDLAPVLSSERWKGFATKHAATRAPGGTMELAFTLDEADLVPEGIAYDESSGTFYLSSTARRKIVQVDRDGRCTDFIGSGQYGYLCGLGLAIDAARQRLWAVSDAPENAGLFDAETVGKSAVHVFDLRDGSLVFSHAFAADEAGPFSLNDVALLPNGDAVVTASARGSLHLLPADGADPREIVPAGRLLGANGIAVGPDGETLYVAQYTIGIQQVSLSGNRVRSASLGSDFTTCFVDGLYYRGGRLYAVQNFGGLDRVASFGLDAAGRLVDCTIHVARQEVFEDPTTGTFADNRFFFIANSRVEPFFSREDKSITTGFGAASIYTVAVLPHSH